jgi:hypothetical protein
MGLPELGAAAIGALLAPADPLFAPPAVPRPDTDVDPGRSVALSLEHAPSRASDAPANAHALPCETTLRKMHTPARYQ